MNTAEIPLFEPGPDDPAVLQGVLHLVMAGRYAQLDNGTVVVLTPAFSRGTSDLPAGHADTLNQLVDTRRIRFGARVTAHVDGETLPAHLLIGPFPDSADE